MRLVIDLCHSGSPDSIPNKMAMRSDEQLIKTGDADGFAEWYRRYERSVLAYFMRRGVTSHEAADLTAETFVRALGARRRFRPCGEGSAAGWLFGIARNVWREHVDASVRRSALVERIGENAVRLTDEQAAEIATLELDHELSSALANLPQEQITLIWRRVVDELDYDQLANDFASSPSAMRQSVSRGLRAVRAALTERTQP